MKRLAIELTLSLSLFSTVAFGQQFQALVYTSPNRWHDPSLPTALEELRRMANRHFFELSWGQSGGNDHIINVFSDEYLKRFDVVVFLHANTGDLNQEQFQSFQRYIRNGGGFVGIHAAGVSGNQDPWYQQLVGRVFTDHPDKQTAVLKVATGNHPATMHLPVSWVWTDEWYAFEKALTDNQVVLLTVDEKSYDPFRISGTDDGTSMGDYHPISWYQEFDGGRFILYLTRSYASFLS